MPTLIVIIVASIVAAALIGVLIWVAARRVSVCLLLLLVYGCVWYVYTTYVHTLTLSCIYPHTHSVLDKTRCVHVCTQHIRIRI